MATYAIGDIQGCFRTLEALLSRVRFDPDSDRLWLVGDLVNRGPRSLEVLRWVKALGERDRAVVVLGNHDIHLLAVAADVGSPSRGDTLDDVLRARDRDELVEWLRMRPFFHREDDTVLVHAGLLPQWSVARAQELAHELEEQLRGPSWVEAVAVMHRKRGGAWSEALAGDERIAAIAGAFARLRTCTKDGTPCRDFKGHPRDAPAGCLPWYAVPGRKSAAATVVFGHWAALGLHLEPNVIGLDSGCVWGQSLSAVRLDDHAVFQERNCD
jgi:bis(5'-nucleosyl)-tetraphosphatase (symmetrical)